MYIWDCFPYIYCSVCATLASFLLFSSICAPGYISARLSYPCANFGSLFQSIIRPTVDLLLNMYEAAKRLQARINGGKVPHATDIYRIFSNKGTPCRCMGCQQYFSICGIILPKKAKITYNSIKNGEMVPFWTQY